MSYNTKNYTEQGGEITHIGGTLKFDEGGVISDFPGAVNQAAGSTSSDTVAKVRADLNALLIKLKNAGLMEPDSFDVSVLSCPTPSSMPTSETAENSGHATLSIDGNDIKIALDCSVTDLKNADHGELWGVHKWLGFGVRTGLSSLVGLKFTDDTGVSVALSATDEAEANALGLSAGDFVIYIKAEDVKYLMGEKSFTLWADGYKETTFTMQILEPDTTE